MNRQSVQVGFSAGRNEANGRVTARRFLMRCRQVSIGLILALACTTACDRQSGSEKELRDRPNGETEAAERGLKILREYSDELLRQDWVYVRVTKTIKMEDVTRSSMPPPSVHTLSLHRPDHLALFNVGGIQGMNVVCDGRRIQVWVTPDTGRWDVLADIPPDAESLFAESVVGKANAMMLRAITLIPSIVDENPYGYVTTKMSDVRYLGIERIDDEDLFRLSMKHPEATVTAWFTTGDRRLLRRVFMDFDSNTKESQMTSEVQYDNWAFDPIDAGVFTVPSPKKAPTTGGA